MALMLGGTGRARSALWMAVIWIVVSPKEALLAEKAWAVPSGELRTAGLRVRTLGQGTPIILLLHGLAGSNRYFGAEFDGLSQLGQLVAPDLLGFGDSPRPSDVDYGPDAHARAVVEALDKLGIEGPIYIVAHSAGSIVALRIAALEPERIRGIVAFAPPFYRSEEDALARIQGLGGMVRLFAMDTFWAKAACKAMYPFPAVAARLASRIRPDLPAPIAEDAVKHSWASYSGTVRNLILAAQPPPDLRTLGSPLWIIAGAEDEILDLNHLKELAESEHVKLEVWPGGHDLPLSDAARSVELIETLVRSGK